MIIALRRQINKDSYPVNSVTNTKFFFSNNWSQKIDAVGLVQAIRNEGEGYLLRLVNDCLYRPVDPENGLRVKNPFDGLNGNGTGGTTQAIINLANPHNTLFSVSFNYYKSFLSYRRPETRMQQLWEILIFFKWYIFMAINMIVAYPAIRVMQKQFPTEGEKFKNWYATSPIYQQSECDVIVK
ncbi:MAG: hypothetical protein EAZ78_16855 [Oscillatoriales cyanobacterium]|uniref:Uncharacterized protein n=1 Tax=Microcoleus anatoxicus PTRS2 TaxID=2705321 RepID=A0ABU8YTB4_9CYAN|nr:MAG: hypothetical protein EAZ96_11310 [Oscillatoriales cyanobacterium]TAF01836.1 MAG: hypothetical protein EAZ78_16855 [Oscillatoriales cyanobacterium]TAF62414.1 MAG: hypothetical protein EAZ59_24060 [Oscillatoriales cyanobacterium]